jgi:TonB family protein
MSDVLSGLILSTTACSVAIAVVLCVRKAMARRFGAGIAYVLWAHVPLASVAVLLPARSVVVVIRALPAPAHLATTAITVDDAAALTMPAPEPAIDAPRWLCDVWMLGIVAAALLFLVQHGRFVRQLGRLEAAGEGVYRSKATHGCPALIGLWRPKIVVPSDFESRYDLAERELILAHERHHLARGDMVANLMATLLRSIFWFNPLVHIAARAFIADQELSCDAAVMTRFPIGRHYYANAMLKAQVDGTHAAWACPWGLSSLLHDRIERLASPSIARSRRWLGNAVAVAMIASGSIVAWASQPTQTQTRYETTAADEAQPTGGAAGEGSLASTSARTIPATDERAAKNTAPVAPSAKPDATIGKRERKVVARSAAALQRAANETSRAPSPPPVAIASESASAIHSPIAEAPIVAPAIDEPPREIASDRREHAPGYPAAAARANIEGRVVLDVGVDEHGLPTDARVATLEPSTATELASASLAAVTRWHFEPARRAGEAIAGRIAVPFVFAMNGSNAYAAAEDFRQASYRTIESGDHTVDVGDVEGVVYLRVRIEGDGAVSASAVDRIDPPSATSLGATALSSLKRWTFNPARDRGKAVASTVVVPVVFGANARSMRSVARIRNGLDPVRVAPGRS